MLLDEGNGGSDGGGDGGWLGGGVEEERDRLDSIMIICSAYQLLCELSRERKGWNEGNRAEIWCFFF